MERRVSLLKITCRICCTFEIGAAFFVFMCFVILFFFFFGFGYLKRWCEIHACVWLTEIPALLTCRQKSHKRVLCIVWVSALAPSSLENTRPFFFLSPEAPWFQHCCSFILRSCKRKLLRVSVTPVQSLRSPRSQTSASLSVARSSCMVANLVC